MLYFAYGSNMPKALIEERVGPCKRIGVAYITGYALRFHKESQVDHTGKCDAYCTGDPTDRVWGAIYRLTQDQIAEMDELEGPPATAAQPSRRHSADGASRPISTWQSRAP